MQFAIGYQICVLSENKDHFQMPLLEFKHKRNIKGFFVFCMLLLLFADLTVFSKNMWVEIFELLHSESDIVSIESLFTFVCIPEMIRYCFLGQFEEHKMHLRWKRHEIFSSGSYLLFLKKLCLVKWIVFFLGNLWRSTFSVCVSQSTS